MEPPIPCSIRVQKIKQENTDESVDVETLVPGPISAPGAPEANLGYRPRDTVANLV